jgi:hypothetical protein
VRLKDMTPRETTSRFTLMEGLAVLFTLVTAKKPTGTERKSSSWLALAGENVAQSRS